MKAYGWGADPHGNDASLTGLWVVVRILTSHLHTCGRAHGYYNTAIFNSHRDINCLRLEFSRGRQVSTGSHTARQLPVTSLLRPKSQQRYLGVMGISRTDNIENAIRRIIAIEFLELIRSSMVGPETRRLHLQSRHADHSPSLKTTRATSFSFRCLPPATSLLPHKPWPSTPTFNGTH